MDRQLCVGLHGYKLSGTYTAECAEIKAILNKSSIIMPYLEQLNKLLDEMIKNGDQTHWRDKQRKYDMLRLRRKSKW